MSVIATSQFKNGVKVMMDGDPCAILENEFVKPGKGQAFNRVKLRNLKTGRVLERTFKSGDTLEEADVLDVELQYLYNDGEFWYFMSPESFEQYSASLNVVSDVAKWLKEQSICIVTLWNGAIITVNPPITDVFKVTDTDPGLRGDTATGGSKPATLETGAVIRVPLFVEIGDLLKVDTRTGEYLSRVKDEA